MEHTVVSCRVLDEWNVDTGWQVLVDPHELHLEDLSLLFLGDILHLAQLQRDLSQTHDEPRGGQEVVEAQTLLFGNVLLLRLLFEDVLVVWRVYVGVQDDVFGFDHEGWINLFIFYYRLPSQFGLHILVSLNDFVGLEDSLVLFLGLDLSLFIAYLHLIIKLCYQLFVGLDAWVEVASVYFYNQLHNGG
jgi:hypothetical protein